MAISDSQKIDYLWKKLGYGATKTDTNANKLAPNEAIASPLILRGNKVWQQAGSIPAVQPGSSAGVVTVYPTSSPRECTEDITATANRSWKTGLTDWVPPEIGSTYQAKVYIATASDAGNASSGDQVFATGSGNDDEWFFDYQSGVLHFIGTNLPDGISFTGKSVYVAGSRYTGAFGVGSSAGEVGNIGNLTVTDTTFTSITASDDIIIDAETGVFKISGTTGFVIPVGNTAQRDGSPDTGLTRYNSETGLLEIYDGSAWESMGDYTATVDSFDGDNSTTAFTMSAESTTDGTIVDINGVVQLPTTAYSVAGNVITFTQAPASGDKVTTRLLVSLVGTSAQAAGSDTQVQFNDGDALAGDSGLTFNKTSNNLTVAGNVSVGGSLTYTPRITYWHLSGDWSVSTSSSVDNWVKQTSGVYYSDTGITYSSGTFTFGEAGVYRINLQIELAGGSGDYVTYQYRKNSSAYGVDGIIRQVSRSANGGTQGFISRVMEVSASDTFDIYITGSSGGSIDATYSSLEFEKIG